MSIPDYNDLVMLRASFKDNDTLFGPLSFARAEDLVMQLAQSWGQVRIEDYVPEPATPQGEHCHFEIKPDGSKWQRIAAPGEYPSPSPGESYFYRTRI